MSKKGRSSSSNLRPVSRRRRPTQQRSRNTVNAILDSAELIIEREGIDRISTLKIAREVGISVGALYGYFPNKESILFTLAQRWLDLNRQAIGRADPKICSYENWREWIDDMVHEVLLVYKKEPGLTRYYDILCSIPELRRLDEEHEEWLIRSISNNLKAFGYTGSAKELRADSLAMLVIAHGLLTRAVRPNEKNGNLLVGKLRQLWQDILQGKLS